MDYFEFGCQKTLSFIMHSWVHQIHLLYCPRLKMPCWLLGFWLTSLVQKSWVIILGILWIDCLAGEEISSKSCKMSLSLDQRAPLPPPTLLSTLQFSVVNFSAESENLTDCRAAPAAPLSTWQASPCKCAHYRGGAELSAAPSTGQQQGRGPFSGMTAFGGLKVCCEFCGFFPKGFS